jgi:putative PIN family toxin of toxin-antitoxin system
VRVVLDPNVYISALIGRPTSSPRFILDALTRDEIQVIASPALIAELDDVLARRKFDAYASQTERAAFVAPALDPAETLAATRDPKDDYLVALALAENVDALVTLDRDLHEAGLDQPPVWTPRQLADWISSQHERFT